MDAQVFRPADHIDPEYGRRLRQAVEKGIEVLAYDVRISLQGIELNKNIPCEL
jgi:sugar fermentation stimulation protein A